MAYEPSNRLVRTEIKTFQKHGKRVVAVVAIRCLVNIIFRIQNYRRNYLNTIRNAFLSSYITGGEYEKKQIYSTVKSEFCEYVDMRLNTKKKLDNIFRGFFQLIT